MKASDVPVSVPKVAAKQEVVPIHYNELPETKAVSAKNGANSVAIRLEYHGVMLLSAMMQMPPLSRQRFLRCNSSVR